MARYLRERVHRETGITVSAGVAPNKFLAKIASDWDKPDGLFVIRPEDVADFVTTLPVEKLFGVGKVTAGRLHGLGIATCGDLREWGQEELVQTFGRQGLRFHAMARGEDERPVVVTRNVKSVSVERTFSQDLPGRQACDRVMEGLVQDLVKRLAAKKRQKPIHKLFIKIRYSDFSTHTLERVREQVIEPEVDDFVPLLDGLYTDPNRPVRLLGLGVRFQDDSAPTRQLRLFDNE
jgi:DNA polymerase-4